MSDSPSSKSAAKPLLLWFLLFFLSLSAGTFLAWIDVPAAFFVASVVCGVTFSLFGSGLTLPRRFFYCAQALVGCSVAKSMTPEVFSVLANNWLVLAGMVVYGVTTVFAVWRTRWG